MRTKRKLVAGIMAVALAVTAVITLNVTPVQAAENEQLMYRMYNPNSGEHFYTSSDAERNNLIEVGWNYEGYGFVASNIGDAVYRMYNPNAGDHHYTTNEAEKNHLVSVGWNYEGIGWYSNNSGEQAMFRLYNPNAKAGTHHYTLSEAEKDYLVSVGWNYEGTSWMSMHNLVSNNDIKLATCISEGYSGGAKCVNCGAEFNGTTLPVNPNNHSDLFYSDDVMYTKSNIYCKSCNELVSGWGDDDMCISWINHFNAKHGTNFPGNPSEFLIAPWHPNYSAETQALSDLFNDLYDANYDQRPYCEVHDVNWNCNDCGQFGSYEYEKNL